MYRKFPIIFIVALASCGKEDKEERNVVIDLTKVKAKRDVYLSKAPQDEKGFLKDEKCDQTTWTALATVGGLKADLTAVEGPEGKYFRRPSKDCFEKGESKSENSQDVYVSVLWALFAKGKTDKIEQIRKFGDDNDWVMGKGVKTRTLLRGELRETIYALAGKDYRGEDRHIPDSITWATPDPTSASNRHIVAAHLALRADKLNRVSGAQLSFIKDLQTYDDNRPLYKFLFHRYTDGNQQETINILLDENVFPDELPKRWYDLVFVTGLLERAKEEANVERRKIKSL